MSLSAARVSAGILLRGTRVLLSLRSADEEMPHTWQFPGGKVLQGENNKEALGREIAEELGVTVVSAHLIGIEQHAFEAHTPIVIYFYVIDSYEGHINALEKQALLWAEIGDVHNLDVLEPNRNVLQRMVDQTCFSSSHNTIWDSVWSTDTEEFSNPVVRTVRANEKLEILKELGFKTKGGDKIGDIGGGSGEVSVLIEQHLTDNSFEIICVDQSLVALKQLQTKLLPGSCIEVFHSDARNIYVPNGFFDKIIALGVIEHLQQPKEFLQELSRILKIDGQLFITQSNSYSMFYLDRVIREGIQNWPYGYQINHTPGKLWSLVDEYFAVEKIFITLPGRDAPAYRMIDRLLHSLCSRWGRTIYLTARKIK